MHWQNRQFCTEWIFLHGDASFPVHCYTSRRFPSISVGGRPRDDAEGDSETLYEIRIIDNDHNTYQEVMQITMQALDISEEQAFAIAWEVDHLGSCAVGRGPRSDADAIAELIRTIGIEVRVSPLNQTAH